MGQIMNFTELALRTESKPTPEMEKRAGSCLRLLHGAMGCGTESGELLDAVKRYIFYGKEVDEVNIIEEMGDIEWYLAILRDLLGVSQEDVQRRVIKKLSVRYGEKFSEVGALVRDFLKEREALETVFDVTVTVPREERDDNVLSEDRKSDPFLRAFTSNDFQILRTAIRQYHPSDSPRSKVICDLFEKLSLVIEWLGKEEDKKNNGPSEPKPGVISNHNIPKSKLKKCDSCSNPGVEMVGVKYPSPFEGRQPLVQKEFLCRECIGSLAST
jgi:NTP pyrophosphatase (non-canonical NTP hydrolase)